MQFRIGHLVNEIAEGGGLRMQHEFRAEPLPRNSGEGLSNNPATGPIPSQNAESKRSIL
jgi:hypothetical protein